MDLAGLVVEAAPTALILVDAAQSIVLVNRAAEQLFGYPREELVGQPLDILLPEGVADLHRASANRFLAEPSPSRSSADRELLGRRRDGAEVPIEIGLCVVDAAGGRFVLASIVDATERRRVRGWFERIVEAAPNAKLVVDSRGTIVLVNRATEVLFGYARSELVGQSIGLLVPSSAPGDHARLVSGYMALPTARPMGAGRDLAGRRKDGSLVDVEIGLTPIESADGMCVLASIFDISDRKRHELELRRSNSDLEQFAHVASHDLQEPLRMVASYTELLAERYRGQLDARAQKYIHYAVDGARRMQRLVSDLLSYSRVGSRGRPLEPVDVESVLAWVLRTFQASIAESGAVVESGPMPTVLADPTQLGQLLQNLVGNALKFRSDSPPHITIAAARHGERWQLSVSDNGIGIDPRDAGRLFTMFTRLPGAERFAGSGIGLAIAFRIVERHQGRIWFEPTAGGGSTFHFTLRAAPASVPESNVNAPD